MDFTIIGTIKLIEPNVNGLHLRVRETKIGSISKNGYMMGEYDYTWECFVSSAALKKYIQTYFKPDYLVKIKGMVEQYRTKEEERRYNVIFKIETIDLWNMGDPKKKKSREKLNNKVLGDERPNTLDSFENDF